LLAGVKTSPAVQILKDEFNRLNKDEKANKIDKFVKDAYNLSVSGGK